MRKIELCLHPRLTNPQKDAVLSKSDFQLLTGVAGTGKTYCALARGLKFLQDESIESLVIVRSAVAVRSIGFLPGDGEEKADPYMAPYVTMLKSLAPKGIPAKLIDFKLTSFERGMTYDDTCIIVDEYQNMSGHELETIITRVGANTKLIICGDSDQSDLPKHEIESHRKIIDIVERMPEFQVINFGINDIVRSAFLKSYFKTKATLNSGKLTDGWGLPGGGLGKTA